MIVLPLDGQLALITQPDHAALAGRVMRAWRVGGLPEHPRRGSILRAIDEHDNGWRELDEQPRYDAATRGIADFITAPVKARQSVWPRGVARLADDPWAAALVAQHARYIYARYRDDAGWRSFFETMATLRDEHTRRALGDLEQLQHDYQFVRIGDLISLAFCNRWTAVQQEGSGPAVWSDGDETVFVRPDPFEGATVPMDVPARVLPDRPFRDQADLDAAWRAAPSIVVSGETRGHVGDTWTRRDT
jgi:hypothetical protein